jgi:hypothetical protein
LWIFISVLKPFNVSNPCDLGRRIITRFLKNVNTPGHIKYWHKDTKIHNKTHKTHKNYEFRTFFAVYSWDLWDTDTSQTAHWTYESHRHRARFIGWEEREYNQFPQNSQKHKISQGFNDTYRTLPDTSICPHSTLINSLKYADTLYLIFAYLNNTLTKWKRCGINKWTENTYTQDIYNLIPKSTISGLSVEVRLLYGTHKIPCKSWFLSIFISISWFLYYIRQTEFNYKFL